MVNPTIDMTGVKESTDGQIILDKEKRRTSAYGRIVLEKARNKPLAIRSLPTVELTLASVHIHAAKRASSLGRFNRLAGPS